MPNKGNRNGELFTPMTLGLHQYSALSAWFKKPSIPPANINCEQEKTGIPCNWKVYASSKDGVPSFASQNEGGAYSKKWLVNYAITGDFHSRHLTLENEPYYTYTEKPAALIIPAAYAAQIEPKVIDVRATSSKNGPELNADVTLDHVLVFYDVSDPKIGAKVDADYAAAAFKQRNPNAIVKVVPMTSNQAIKEALNDQLEFTKNNIGKENVAVYFSSHGTTENKNASTSHEDNCGIISSNTTSLVTETDIETHMQACSNEVEGGFLIVDTCHSGAFTDNDS